jgi:nucleoside-diphosphate-sugar epimerase
MANAMGVKPRRIVVGRRLLVLMGFIGQLYGAAFSRPVQINRMRMQELLETDWSLNPARLQNDLGVTAQYSIDTAMQELVRWYRRNNWL